VSVCVYALMDRTVAGHNCSEGVLRPRQPREAGPFDRCVSFFICLNQKKVDSKGHCYLYYTDEFGTCDLFVVLITTQIIINTCDASPLLFYCLCYW
jgi:hypothetical protein